MPKEVDLARLALGMTVDTVSLSHCIDTEAVKCILIKNVKKANSKTSKNSENKKKSRYA